MGKNQTSIFENGLIWFGAGVSIAEIVTGTYFAPVGFLKGVLAILVGHFIGCSLLFLFGFIGGEVRKSSMETVKMSFGQKGGLMFAFLNVLQLVGWTAIMIYDGALAANGIWAIGHWIWCLLIGILILLWIFIGVTHLGKLNAIAMITLFILTLILSKKFFYTDHVTMSLLSFEHLTFGEAVELSVAMPLSWLPLISDYTCKAEKTTKAAVVSSITYGIVSCWMYIIGMGAAIYTGEYELVQVFLKVGLGVVGLLIIVLSTVTTTFLDTYSAGISSKSIWEKLNEKWMAMGATMVGMVAAILYPMDDITDFLYLIGSVFAPMVAIQISDFFLLKKDFSQQNFCWSNLVIWLIGFILYRNFMRIDFFLGNTLLTMVVIILICVFYNKVMVCVKKKSHG